MAVPHLALNAQEAEKRFHVSVWIFKIWAVFIREAVMRPGMFLALALPLISANAVAVLPVLVAKWKKNSAI